MTDERMSLPATIRSGLLCRCPRCGRGKLLQGFLNLRPRCEACGLDYGFADAGDGPAIFVMLLAGFVVVGSALIVEFRYAPPFWIHAVLWLPLILVTTLFPLRAIKGLLIALLFIVLILTVGVSSRVSRSFELRVSQVQFDEAAIEVLKTHPIRPLRFVSHHPGRASEAEYSKQELRVRQMVHLPEDEPFLFLEVEVDDASEFTDVVEVTGLRVGPYSVLKARGSSIPNTIAAVMLTLRKKGAPPQVYMRWTEESPLQLALDFVIGGRGDVPPLTREILRRAEPDRDRRPIVHVGG